MEKTVFSLMIVDDEPAIRNGIYNAVAWETLNLDVTHLEQDSVNALSIIEEEKTDIVITDLMMPRMNGLELIRKVREKGINTRFIILTGYDDFKFAKEAIKLNVEDFLLKPLSRTELITTLTKTISKIAKEKKESLEHEKLSSSAKTLVLNRLINGEYNFIRQNLIDLNLNILNLFPLTVIVIDNHDEKNTLPKPNCILKGRNEIFTYDINYEIIISSDTDKSINHYAKALEEQIRQNKLKTKIGIGVQVESFGQLQQSFQSALLALSYKIYSSDKIIYSQNIIVNDKPTFGSDDIDTQELIRLICAGSNSDVYLWTDNFFSRLIYTKTPPPSYVKGMCIFLLTDLKNRLMKDRYISSSFFPQMDYSIINSLSSLEEIKQWVKDLFIEIKEKTIPNSEMANDPIIYKARKLVEDSISYQISAQEVADKLDMNLTYFSTYFKQKTGETFTSYVAKLRNQFAKSLLSDPLLQVDEIAESLGYTDYRSFCRSFKKANGITPTEYRTNTK